MRIFLLSLLIFPSFILACSGGDDTPEQAFCSDVEDLGGSLKDLAGSIVDLDSEQIRKNVDKVRSDFEAVQQSAAEVNAPSREALESSFNQLRDAVLALGQGGGQDVRSLLITLQIELSGFIATLDTWRQAYDCS
jgi:hypothetical protein